jgi:hypothetical protein
VTDPELVDRLRHRDPDAIAQILERYLTIFIDIRTRQVIEYSKDYQPI